MSIVLSPYNTTYPVTTNRPRQVGGYASSTLKADCVGGVIRAGSSQISMLAQTLNFTLVGCWVAEANGVHYGQDVSDWIFGNEEKEITLSTDWENFYNATGRTLVWDWEGFTPSHTTTAPALPTDPWDGAGIVSGYWTDVYGDFDHYLPYGPGNYDGPWGLGYVRNSHASSVMFKSDVFDCNPSGSPVGLVCYVASEAAATATWDSQAGIWEDEPYYDHYTSYDTTWELNETFRTDILFDTKEFVSIVEEEPEEYDETEEGFGYTTAVFEDLIMTSEDLPGTGTLTINGMVVAATKNGTGNMDRSMGVSSRVNMSNPITGPGMLYCMLTSTPHGPETQTGGSWSEKTLASNTVGTAEMDLDVKENYRFENTFEPGTYGGDFWTTAADSVHSIGGNGAHILWSILSWTDQGCNYQFKCDTRRVDGVVLSDVQYIDASYGTFTPHSPRETWYANSGKIKYSGTWNFTPYESDAQGQWKGWRNETLMGNTSSSGLEWVADGAYNMGHFETVEPGPTTFKCYQYNATSGIMGPAYNSNDRRTYRAMMKYPRLAAAWSIGIKQNCVIDSFTSGDWTCSDGVTKSVSGGLKIVVDAGAVDPYIMHTLTSGYYPPPHRFLALSGSTISGGIDLDFGRTFELQVAPDGALVWDLCSPTNENSVDTITSLGEGLRPHGPGEDGPELNPWSYALYEVPYIKLHLTPGYTYTFGSIVGHIVTGTVADYQHMIWRPYNITSLGNTVYDDVGTIYEAFRGGTWSVNGKSCMDWYTTKRNTVKGLETTTILQDNYCINDFLTRADACVLPATDSFSAWTVSPSALAFTAVSGFDYWDIGNSNTKQVWHEEMVLSCKEYSPMFWIDPTLGSWNTSGDGALNNGNGTRVVYSRPLYDEITCNNHWGDGNQRVNNVRTDCLTFHVMNYGGGAEVGTISLNGDLPTTYYTLTRGTSGYNTDNVGTYFTYAYPPANTDTETVGALTNEHNMYLRQWIHNAWRTETCICTGLKADPVTGKLLFNSAGKLVRCPD